MAITSASQVLIVGAGPVGLTAALALSLNGIKPRIIDRLSAPAAGQRGSTIAPRTLEAYNILGILPDILKLATPFPDIQDYSSDGVPGKRFSILTRLPPSPAVPMPNHMQLGQDYVAAILREHLERRFGVTVEWGAKCTQLQHDEEGVDVVISKEGHEEQVRAQYVLGADGARSAVRKLAGFSFEGETAADTRMLIGDVELSGFDEDPVIHTFKDGNGNMCMIRPVPERQGMCFIVVRGSSFDLQRACVDRDYLLSHIRAITHREDIQMGAECAVADWQLNVRMVDSLQKGRVLLAGDAAHVHSPTGGQGLNSGIMDAMNLAWKLALILHNAAPRSLLDTYSAERIPPIREMLDITTTRTKHNFALKRTADAAAHPLAFRMLGVQCRGSDIVCDELVVDRKAEIEEVSAYGGEGEDGGRLHAGDRAPDAPGLRDAEGMECRLYDVFSAAKHTVLVFDATLVNDVLAAIQSFKADCIQTRLVLPSDTVLPTGDHGAEVLIDAQGHAFEAYSARQGVSVAIVRPDGVVGGILKSAEGVHKYFVHVAEIPA
ncbi:hypothetical protein PENSPDRAFT_401488 [Peniophora sp. CONT]|nr:hypothetical protein PENSPDRAFT_401488 [Peniophora sp. CONT]